ncbi:unnamed protein product, partial [Notodromas monacha]
MWTRDPRYCEGRRKIARLSQDQICVSPSQLFCLTLPIQIIPVHPFNPRLHFIFRKQKEISRLTKSASFFSFLLLILSSFSHDSLVFSLNVKTNRDGETKYNFCCRAEEKFEVMTNERVEDANNGGKKLSLFKSWQTWFHDSSSSSSNEASDSEVSSSQPSSQEPSQASALNNVDLSLMTRKRDPGSSSEPVEKRPRLTPMGSGYFEPEMLKASVAAQALNDCVSSSRPQRIHTLNFRYPHCRTPLKPCPKSPWAASHEQEIAGRSRTVIPPPFPFSIPGREKQTQIEYKLKTGNKTCQTVASVGNAVASDTSDLLPVPPTSSSSSRQMMGGVCRHGRPYSGVLMTDKGTQTSPMAASVTLQRKSASNRVNKKGFFFWVSSYLRKLNKKLPEDVNGKKEFVVQQFQGAENNKLRQKRTWRESAGNDDELLDQRMNNIGQGDHEAREQRPVNYPDHHPQHQNQQQRHHIIHQHDEDALLQQKPRRVPFHLPSCPGRRCRLCLAGTIASVSHVKHVPGITDTEHWAKGRVKFAPVAIGSDSQAALDAQEWMDRGSETLVRRSSDRVACYSPRKRRKLMEPFAENENVGMEDETPQMIPENASRSTAVHHDLITHHHQHHQQQQPEEDALASGMTLRNIYGPHSSGFGIPSPFTTHNRLTGFERRHAQIGELMGLSANYIFNNNQDLNEVLQTRDRMEAGEFLVDLVGQTQDRFQKELKNKNQLSRIFGGTSAEPSISNLITSFELTE